MLEVSFPRNQLYIFQINNRRLWSVLDTVIPWCSLRIPLTTYSKEVRKSIFISLIVKYNSSYYRMHSHARQCVLCMANVTRSITWLHRGFGNQQNYSTYCNFYTLIWLITIVMNITFTIRVFAACSRISLKSRPYLIKLIAKVKTNSMSLPAPANDRLICRPYSEKCNFQFNVFLFPLLRKNVRTLAQIWQKPFFIYRV